MQSPIGAVLMPGDKGSVVRKLYEPCRLPHQDVGADHPFHRVQNLGMRGDLVNPWENKMGLRVQRPALAGEQVFQILTMLLSVVVEFHPEFRSLLLAEG